MTTPINSELYELLKKKGFDRPYNWYELSVPTIAEVLVWLYENHKIWILTYPREYVGLILMWSYSIIKIEENYVVDGLEFPEVDSPEDIPVWNNPKETYEAAIEYILKSLL